MGCASHNVSAHAPLTLHAGGICSVTLLGQPIVILNSASVMEEMDTKSAVFSTRPRLPMAGELVGYDQTLVLMPYGSKFRVFRTHFAKLIGTPAVLSQFIPLVENETHRFLKRLLLNPNADAVSAHVRKLTGAIILRITYGIDVQEEQDSFVTLIQKANDNFNVATAPGKFDDLNSRLRGIDWFSGAFLVDVFPAMLHIPEILAPWKRTARIWARATKNMVEAPYLFVQRQMAAGTAPISFVSRLLEHEEKLSEEDIHNVKYTASSLYGGGADTTAAALYAFFLAMVLFPVPLDVQREAQEEIDSVIGGARLPQFTDREQLPYIAAVVTELLRWHSVAPLGVPHAAVEDAILNDHLIPKGCIIIANLWNMLHDAETYPEPAAFRPERYLGTPTQRDPRTIVFGFGRRVCPGRELAEASVFLCVATTLATFNIGRGAGPLPVHENLQGTISHPRPFDCIVKPRSERAVELIGEV
ncbi:cytochrome P450 [Mycena alexandri]|uniref:Cytochrome P450 n=1 Tax=Mycena alexandri TaxID=1745969 RepID=A0AAD6X8M5_9AGAR|nr:cytochrome P450 [Mycena alexandri]